jgi:hypothetical protein
MNFDGCKMTKVVEIFPMEGSIYIWKENPNNWMKLHDLPT